MAAESRVRGEEYGEPRARGWPGARYGELRGASCRRSGAVARGRERGGARAVPRRSRQERRQGRRRLHPVARRPGTDRRAQERRQGGAAGRRRRARLVRRAGRRHGARLAHWARWPATSSSSSSRAWTASRRSSRSRAGTCGSPRTPRGTRRSPPDAPPDAGRAAVAMRPRRPRPGSCVRRLRADAGGRPAAAGYGAAARIVVLGSRAALGPSRPQESSCSASDRARPWTRTGVARLAARAGGARAADAARPRAAVRAAGDDAARGGAHAGGPDRDRALPDRQPLPPAQAGPRVPALAARTGRAHAARGDAAALHRRAAALQRRRCRSSTCSPS